MIRPRGALRSTFAVLAGVAGLAPAQQTTMPSPSSSQQVAGRRTPPGNASERPEVIMWRALRSNPLTAPYAINVTWKDGAVILAGRVGTKQVHDAAVQMAIAFGFRFRDDLVIDTAETFRVAMSASPSMTGYGAFSPKLSSPYYVYPQPLFGWLDDPFFGMEPPPVTFAPWAGARRDAATAGPYGPGQMAMGPGVAPGGGNAAMGNPAMDAAAAEPQPGERQSRAGSRTRPRTATRRRRRVAWQPAGGRRHWAGRGPGCRRLPLPRRTHGAASGQG